MLSLRRASLAASAAAVIAVAAILSAQAGNPLTGNWTINLARSKYKSRQPYTARFDGKPYPVKSTIDGKPNPNQDSITWKKIDDYTYENVAILKGNALTTTRVTISRDGKTRTNTSLVGAGGRQRVLERADNVYTDL